MLPIISLFSSKPSIRAFLLAVRFPSSLTNILIRAGSVGGLRNAAMQVKPRKRKVSAVDAQR